MLDNGITVYCDGQTRHLELEKDQAERLLWYAGVASEANSVGPRPPLSRDQVDARIRRSRTVEENAGTLKTHLSMLAGLDTRQLALVISFLDLIEYGDSWMLETVNGLLGEVLCEGPGKAMERNPRDVLADIAYDLFDWWDNVDTARTHVTKHPELFPLPATPEPATAPEPAQPATVQPANAQRTRKPRKQGRHA